MVGATDGLGVSLLYLILHLVEAVGACLRPDAWHVYGEGRYLGQCIADYMEMIG